MTSGPRFEKPHAICWLWPMTTPGMPEKVTPLTSKGQSSVSRVQCRPIWYQMPGTETLRCGSLARIGLPVVEWSPSTTQALEPIPSPLPTIAGSPRSAWSTWLRARLAAGASGGRDGLRVPVLVAFCSNTPSTTAPWSTIGRCRP